MIINMDISPVESNCQSVNGGTIFLGSESDVHCRKGKCSSESSISYWGLSIRQSNEAFQKSR